MGPHLSLLKYQTPLSPFLFTFLSAVLLNSQPLTFISKISAIHLLHSTPFLKSPVNHQCKKEKKNHLFLSLQPEKSQLCLHITKVLSSPQFCAVSTFQKSEQSEQASDLHHKLLVCLLLFGSQAEAPSPRARQLLHF